MLTDIRSNQRGHVWNVIDVVQVVWHQTRLHCSHCCIMQHIIARKIECLG